MDKDDQFLNVLNEQAELGDNHSEISKTVSQRAKQLSGSQQRNRSKSMWKRMRQGGKKRLKKFNKDQEKRVWGEDAEKYNTVGQTIFFCKFELLQLTRLLSLLVLMLCVFVFFYIYVKAAFFHYIFLALFVTFLAFGFIFIGSGKQVVYQKLVNNGSIDYSDKKKKSNLWRTGVILYSIAIPLVMTTNFIYFVPLNWFTKLFDAQQLTKHPLLDVTNQSFQEDINEKIEIYYSRIYNPDENHDQNDWGATGANNWRQNFVKWSVLIPAICLGFDFLINKIHIRFFQIKYTFLVNFLFFLVSVVIQASMGAPMYVDNLNWFCDNNHSFLYSDQQGQNIIHKNLINKTCQTWEALNPQTDVKVKIHCEPLTTTYYCPAAKDDVEHLKSLGAHPYSAWKNCWLFVTVVMVFSLLSFCLSWGIHIAKLCGAEPYRGFQKQNKVIEISEQKPKDQNEGGSYEAPTSADDKKDE